MLPMEVDDTGVVTVKRATSCIKLSIFDPVGGNKRARIDGFGDCIVSVVFSHGNTLMVGRSLRNSFQVFDVPTGRNLCEVEGHVGTVISLCFNPTNTLLASGSTDHTIVIWSTSDWEKMFVLHGHSSWVKSMCFNHSGSMLVSGSYGEIKMWDLSREECVKTAQEEDTIVSSLSFNRDDSMLVSGQCNHAIIVWDAKSMERKSVILIGFDYPSSVSFNADSTLIIGEYWGKMITMWDVNTGSEIRNVPGILCTGFVTKYNFFVSIEAGKYYLCSANAASWLYFDRLVGKRIYDSKSIGKYFDRLAHELLCLIGSFMPKYQ